MEDEVLENILSEIPQQVQVQYSLDKQLENLYIMANRLGLYDAADLIRYRYLEKA